ncbi:MAG: hypothetical protein MUF08_00500 [Burkholderiaceae bacterium]|nr:hypothetical protein [Burkholderiaceae bacterium]
MAYIALSDWVDEDVAAASSLTIPIPVGHQAGDLLIAIVTQDGGSGTFAVTGGTGWSALFAEAQAAHNGQRCYGWMKLAESSAEGALTIGSTLADNIGASILVIRGVDQATPIQQKALASATASSNQFPFPSIATTEPCLLLYGGSFDSSSTCVFANPAELTMEVMRGTVNLGAAQYIGFTDQESAGTRPDYKLRRANGGNGSTFVIAVKDNGDGQRRLRLSSYGTVLRHLGVFGSLFDPVDTLAAGNTIAASIDGFTTQATTGSNSVGGAPNVSAGLNTHTFFSTVDSLASEQMCGSVLVFPASEDWSGLIITGQIDFLDATTTLGKKGLYLVVVDSGGNWAAHHIVERGLYSAIYFNRNYLTFALDLVNMTPAASSGTLNLGSVAKLGVLYTRGGTSAAATRGYWLRNLHGFKKQAVKVVGGGAPLPTGLQLQTLLNPWTFADELRTNPQNSLLQGKTQLLPMVPLQFGDGTNKTVVSFSAFSNATLRPYSNSTFVRRFKLTNNSLEIRIKGGPADVFDLGSSQWASLFRSDMVIDSASSASASYNFAGMVMYGFAVSNDVAGVVLNDAAFSACYTITLNGGSMSGCTVRQSVQTAVVTNDPSKVTGCAFVANASLGGHAIEITVPGTYAFSGNTFDGYGANGTTDAAIYNNSGGAVTLNIVGGDTPTVRNGSGASTTVNNNVSITVEGLVVGSAVRVERVSDGSEVESLTADATTEVFSVSGGAAYRIKVRKGSAAPKYLPFETQTGTLSADTSVFVAQVADPFA